MAAIIAKLERKHYLGYGVYIGWNPDVGEYVLWTEREGETHWIAMTPEEIDSLNRYTRPG